MQFTKSIVEPLSITPGHFFHLNREALKAVILLIFIKYQGLLRSAKVTEIFAKIDIYFHA